jgi:hypothetical protein
MVYNTVTSLNAAEVLARAKLFFTSSSGARGAKS